MDHTDPETVNARFGEALFARSHPDHELSAPARQFAHMTIPEIARETLRRNGTSVSGLSTETVLTRALHSTSDFPLILGNAVNREMMAAYNEAPSGVRPLAKQSTARDFRLKRKLQLGQAPELEKVGEAGEFKSGTIAEGGESYRIETFGKIFGITRQAMVNDDLGALNEIPQKMGLAARAFENDFLVKMLTANPAMSDGKPVFHADHNNLTMAGEPNATSLTSARLKMRK